MWGRSRTDLCNKRRRIPPAMIAGKVAGEAAAEFVAGKCRLEEYDRRWRAHSDLSLNIGAGKAAYGWNYEIRCSHECSRLFPQEQMKIMQCGKLPSTVKLGLRALNRAKKLERKPFQGLENPLKGLSKTACTETENWVSDFTLLSFPQLFLLSLPLASFSLALLRLLSFS